MSGAEENVEAGQKRREKCKSQIKKRDVWTVKEKQESGAPFGESKDNFLAEEEEEKILK